MRELLLTKKNYCSARLHYYLRKCGSKFRFFSARTAKVAEFSHKLTKVDSLNQINEGKSKQIGYPLYGKSVFEFSGFRARRRLFLNSGIWNSYGSILLRKNWIRKQFDFWIQCRGWIRKRFLKFVCAPCLFICVAETAYTSYIHYRILWRRVGNVFYNST